MSTYGPEIFTTHGGRTVTLRHALPEDAQAVLDFLRAIRRESDQIASTPQDPLPSETQEVRFITDRLENEGSLFLLAVDEGRVVGTCGFENGKKSRMRHTGELGIAVRAAWQGQGLGRAMMGALIRWGKANPVVERLTLKVFENNARALKLYRDCGFVKEGRLLREIKLAHNQYANTLAMSLWVGPEGYGSIED